jgi:spore germination protein YaaH
LAQIDIKRPKPLSKTIILLGIGFALALIFSSIFIYFYPFTSNEKQEYFIGEYPILYKGKQVGNALVEGEMVYVPLDFMKQIDESLFFDHKSNSIILTTANKVVQMPTDSLKYFINQEPVELHLPPLKAENGELFLALDSVLSFYSFNYQVLPITNAILIQTDGEKLQAGEVTSEDVNEEFLRLRVKPGRYNAFVAQLQHGEKITIEGEKQEFYFIRKENGMAGYVEKEYINPGEETEIVVDREKSDLLVPKIEGPIHLTWEAVYTNNPDTLKIPDMTGVNVVSPTWFHLISKDGTLQNLGSLDYVNWAKSQDYQVWGVFSNSFDPELTHESFKDFETRQKIVRQLLHYTQIYGLGGINLDIENVNPEDGHLVTQFVRELTPYLHEAGLIVSVDITFISTSGNWSAFYEREKLAEIVDYLVVMAYDEHWASSPTAGSVASLPWVEENLNRLLEVVPKDQLILGVPLYTRLWKEEKLKDGRIEVSSKSMSMSEAKEWVDKNKIEVVYDQKSGQNYAEFYDEAQKATYKVWLEDELSLQKRAELARNHGLAGIGSWSRYFADQTAWHALQPPIGEMVTKNQ